METLKLSKNVAVVVTAAPAAMIGDDCLRMRKVTTAEAAAKADAVLAASSIVTAALASINFYAADALRFMSQCIQRQNFFFIFEMFYFSRGYATLHLAVLVSGSVHPSVTFLVTCYATLPPALTVRRSVGDIFEFRAVLALLLLPSRPRLSCCVSSLV